jgi:predicted peptidase
MTSALLLLALATGVPLQDSPDVFRRVLHLDDGSAVQYAVAVPRDLDPGRPVPLILALHYGWRGELPAHYGEYFLRTVILPAFAELEAIVVAPNCPAATWHAVRSERAVLALLDTLRAEFGVAQQKILVAGVSLGGMGAWFLAAQHPDLFNAAVPVAAIPMLDRPAAGSDLDSLLDRFQAQGAGLGNRSVRVPVLVVHSRHDQAIPFAGVARAVEALRAAGAPVQLVAIDGASHNDMPRYVAALKAASSWIRTLWRTP